MSAPTIGRRQRWAPSATAQIDWSHPLAAGLTGYWLPASGHYANLVNQADALSLVRLGGGHQYRPSVLGPAYGESGTSLATEAPHYELVAPSAPLLPTGRASMMWGGLLFENQNSPNRRFLSVEHNNANATPFVAYGMYRPSSTQVAFACDGGGSFTAATATLNNGEHVLLLSYDGANLRGYDQGVQIATTAKSGSLTYDSTARVVYGSAEVAGSSKSGGGFAAAVMATWNRALDASDAAQLHADPFCMLRW